MLLNLRGEEAVCCPLNDLTKSALVGSLVMQPIKYQKVNVGLLGEQLVSSLQQRGQVRQ
jgi:hypothetical protein